MSHLTQKTPLSPQRHFRRTGADPAWLWWFVMGSSIALHLLLLRITLPLATHVAARPQTETSIPVDLIELAPAPNAQSAQPISRQAPASTAKPSIATESSSSAEAAPTTRPPTRSTLAPTTNVETNIVLAPSPAASPPAPIAPAPAPTITPSAPSPSPSPSVPPESPAQSPAPFPSPSLAPEPLPSVAAAPVALPSPIPLPTPTASPSPPFTTIPIDTPVPDVSGTLAVSPTPTSSNDLAQVETSRLAVPALLTAQITATPLPAEQPEATPDTTARPKEESQTFSADPTTSLCAITPEAVQYLGSTITVQVVTNETGQVTEAIVQEPSPSPAFDELATCMVKQWQFEPAIKEGQPVPSNVVVAIRIS